MSSSRFLISSPCELTEEDITIMINASRLNRALALYKSSKEYKQRVGEIPILPEDSTTLEGNTSITELETYVTSLDQQKHEEKVREAHEQAIVNIDEKIKVQKQQRKLMLLESILNRFNKNRREIIDYKTSSKFHAFKKWKEEARVFNQKQSLLKFDHDLSKYPNHWDTLKLKLIDKITLCNHNISPDITKVPIDEVQDHVDSACFANLVKAMLQINKRNKRRHFLALFGEQTGLGTEKFMKTFGKIILETGDLSFLDLSLDTLEACGILKHRSAAFIANCDILFSTSFYHENYKEGLPENSKTGYETSIT